ncbi:hypothetical protein D9619_012185 [Psilocybe cf. subviscida]|uniref:Tryptophan--tRNA ligase, mitochondrial n=1 Tax=Psilocybe cf. subviscida TaxID=2480587 RepID=A0A8H5B795_9AGAR|nr:hypothetical protein D9619_012185 [Psilocybe cf. subviscida]
MFRTLAATPQRHLARQARRYATQEATESKTNERPRVIFSGIQPTGVLHLGNYLGAISNWVKLQNEAPPQDDIIFSVVGWHALTMPQNPKELSASRRDMLATLLAFGIDHKRSTLFYQEDNQCHAELSWILSCITPVQQLKRMTTWKSKLVTQRNANDESEVDESMLNAGLFTYPILQAADILAYRATHVPVGEDQTQHLELSRDLAESFNRTFAGKKRFLPIPTQMITPCRRVLSLRDPSAKMSKSAPSLASRILLTDTESQIRNKFRSAVTDSIQYITYDPANRPGTSNLLNILAACTNETVEEVARRYSSKNHSDLKADVGEAVENMLKQPRAEFHRLREDKDYLAVVAKEGAEKAKERSSRTMTGVRKLVGLY